jgi:hypothetical protein
MNWPIDIIREIHRFLNKDELKGVCKEYAEKISNSFIIEEDYTRFITEQKKIKYPHIYLDKYNKNINYRKELHNLLVKKNHRCYKFENNIFTYFEIRYVIGALCHDICENWSRSLDKRLKIIIELYKLVNDNDNAQKINNAIKYILLDGTYLKQFDEYYNNDLRQFIYNINSDVWVLESIFIYPENYGYSGYN